MLKEKIASPNILSQLLSYSQRKKLRQKVESSESITISFLGDIKQNIEGLLNKIHCSEQNKSQIKSILNFYADKIIKLRDQRNFYKNLLALQNSRRQQELRMLQQKLATLQQELLLQKVAKNAEICTCGYSRVSLQQFGNFSNQNICFCQEQPRFQYKSQQNYEMLKDRDKNSKISQNLLQNKRSHISNLQDQLLISHTNQKSAKDEQLTLSNNQLLSSRIQEQSQKIKTISQQEIMKMMLKYNLGTEELEDILKNYEGVEAAQEKDQKNKIANNTIQDNYGVQAKKKAGKGVKKSKSSKYRNS